MTRLRASFAAGRKGEGTCWEAAQEAVEEESRRMRHDQYLRGSKVGESSKGRGKIGERACAIKERSDGFKLGRNGGGRGLIES